MGRYEARLLTKEHGPQREMPFFESACTKNGLNLLDKHSMCNTNELVELPDDAHLL